MPTSPKLTEWMTGAEIASYLGVSRNTVNKMMNKGKFSSLHRIGERPIFVVQRSEVVQMGKDRANAETS